ncbi:hypothetical protein [Paramixta manurensis]|uniref:hypothetical protein n=1 Tax=Paramixta manurensis TaxID=2740817 RepID=UPI003392BAE0
MNKEVEDWKGTNYKPAEGKSLIAECKTKAIWGANKLLILIVVVIAIVVGKVGSHLGSSVVNGDVVWNEFAKKTAEQKLKMHFPVRVSDTATFRDMYVRGHELHYIYDIDDIFIDSNSLQPLNNMLSSSFKKTFCNEDIISKYDGAVVFTYNFFGKKKDYRFTTRDCDRS